MSVEPPITRLQRLLALLPWLVANPDCELTEVAQRFDASEREILNDVALLTMTGPDQFGGGLVDIAYEGRVITVRDAQGLSRPVNLRRSEVIPLIVGLRIFEEEWGADEAVVARDLIERLQALVGLPGGDSEVVLEQGADDKDHREYMQLINEAIDGGLHVSFNYVSSKDEEPGRVRVVKPLKVEIGERYPYLHAHDIEVAESRIFRLDRMSALNSADDANVEALIDESRHRQHNSRAKDATVKTFRITLSKGARYALDELAHADIVIEDDDSLVVEMPLYSTDWANQAVLSLLPWLISVEPVQVREGVIDSLERNVAAHQT